MESKEELYRNITALKIIMIQTSSEKGMNDPLTIQASQNLDQLIHKYMKLIHAK